MDCLLITYFWVTDIFASAYCTLTSKGRGGVRQKSTSQLVNCQRREEGVKNPVNVVYGRPLGKLSNFSLYLVKVFFWKIWKLIWAKKSGHGYYCLVLLQAEWFLGGRHSCCCRGDQGAYGGQWTDWALEKTHWSHGITKFPHEVVDLTLSSYGTEGESSLMPSHRFLTGFFQASIDNHCMV